MWVTVRLHHKHLPSSWRPNHVRHAPVGACPHCSWYNLVANDVVLVVGIGLLLPALLFRLYPKHLLHLSASHWVKLAADLPLEMYLALFEAEVYGHSTLSLPMDSHAMFTWWSASSLLRIAQCPGTQWISNVMPLVRRAVSFGLIRRASHFPGPSSGFAVCQIAASE